MTKRFDTCKIEISTKQFGRNAMSTLREYLEWYKDHGTNMENRLNEFYRIDPDNMDRALELMFDERLDSNSTDEEFEEITDFHHEFLMSLEPYNEPYMTNDEYWRMTMW